MVNRVPSPTSQIKPARLRDISPIKEFSFPKGQITSNDIIQLHQELKGFDGNFQRLFSN